MDYPTSQTLTLNCSSSYTLCWGSQPYHCIPCFVRFRSIPALLRIAQVEHGHSSPYLQCLHFDIPRQQNQDHGKRRWSKHCFECAGATLHSQYTPHLPHAPWGRRSRENRSLHSDFHWRKTGVWSKFSSPTGCDHTAPAVSELFLPDNMLDGWVIATNAYAASRLSRRRCRDVSRAHILRFIATVMYMGVVRLPSKDDYFVDPDDQTSDFWPRHSPIKLTHAMFKYLWRSCWAGWRVWRWRRRDRRTRRCYSWRCSNAYLVPQGWSLHKSYQ